MPPSTTYDETLRVLGKYMSPILAKSVLQRALDRAGVSERAVSESNLPQVIESLEGGAKLFVDPSRSAQLSTELSSLGAADVPIPDEQLTVRTERDIAEARVKAWQIAERLGAPRYTLQRVATIVSELARNIASYTPGGVIHLSLQRGPQSRLTIRAEDQGSGIPNLDEIMSGRYRSRTGLGVGIVATKRLSDAFSIDTGPKGTRIVVEVRL